MSIFEEMYPYRQFDSWRDFDDLKRMLGEAVSRGFVEEVPVMKKREVPRTENWYRDKETGDIYSLIPPEPAAAAGGAGARQGGGPITGFRKHGLNQAISRDGVGVANQAILDAVKNPTQVISQSGGRTMYVGKDATVVTNAKGQVITTWANGSAGQR